MTSPTLAKKIAGLTLTKKAQDVVIMDLRGLTSMADFFVVCSADSDVQLRAIADAVEEGIGKKGGYPWHRESGSANWLLLDYVDVVLHVFHRTIRPYYNLEKLWGDAVMERVEEPRRALARRPARPVRVARKAARRTMAS